MCVPRRLLTRFNSVHKRTDLREGGPYSTDASLSGNGAAGLCSFHGRGMTCCVYQMAQSGAREIAPRPAVDDLDQRRAGYIWQSLSAIPVTIGVQRPRTRGLSELPRCGTKPQLHGVGLGRCLAPWRRSFGGGRRIPGTRSCGGILGSTQTNINPLVANLGTGEQGLPPCKITW